MKKITAFPLLLANLLLLAACGGSEVSNDTTASAGGDTTAAPGISQGRLASDASSGVSGEKSGCPTISSPSTSTGSM